MSSPATARNRCSASGSWSATRVPEKEKSELLALASSLENDIVEQRPAAAKP